MVRKEADLRGKGPYNIVVRDFLNNSEEKLKKINNDTKTAQNVFKECVEYFGESSRNADANAFFSLLVRFTKAFKVGYKPMSLNVVNQNFLISFCMFIFYFKNRPLIRKMNNAND